MRAVRRGLESARYGKIRRLREPIGDSAEEVERREEASGGSGALWSIMPSFSSLLRS